MPPSHSNKTKKFFRRLPKAIAFKQMKAKTRTLKTESHSGFEFVDTKTHLCKNILHGIILGSVKDAAFFVFKQHNPFSYKR